VFCFFVFACQYQCNWLPGKTCLWSDLLCVEWDVKPYALTHCLPQFADSAFAVVCTGLLQCL